MSKEVIHYMVANGMTELKGDGFYNDVSPFSDFEGTIINQDEFPETSEIMLEFSNASGRKRKTSGSGKERRTGRRTKRGELKDSRERRREERHKSRMQAKQSRQDARKEKLAIKKGEADTQKQLAESLSQPSSDDALLNALKSAPAPTPDQPKGMSKGLKIGLIVGGLLVVGVGVYLIIRKKSKK
jgi:hypothetical protein